MEDDVRQKIEAIEAELRRIGMWDLPQPEGTTRAGAFGSGAMSFEQWLRWVFVPRVHELLASGGPWPGSSEVATKAYREWRMWGAAPDVDRLLELLGEFDALFARPGAG